MLHSTVHPSEKRDRQVQALHHKLTMNNNAQAKAIDNDDWDKLSQLQDEHNRLSEQLGSM